MIERILNEESVRKSWTQYLKEHSSYYPSIFYKVKDNDFGEELYGSTIVRKKMNDEWYTIHVVESFCNSYNNPLKPEEAERLLNGQIMRNVYGIYLFYIVSGKYENLDKLQISEEDRIKKLMGM